MSVMIEELEVQAQPQPVPTPALADGAQDGGGEIDERALMAALARESWRHERLVAD